ncbi:DUF3159 domain-containing protein [Micromonospora violae]|uniref:DUF3159 domain-containing protein n=1 Tax=Micromonospora violae TaxID=1278207 RepID=UPI001ABEF54C|nr:DUF3159 domain-containing protein [Micromonospora violae]
MTGEPVPPGSAESDPPAGAGSPTTMTTLWERTGGLTGLIQSSLPPTVLVISNSLWGVYPAIAAAVAAGVLITALRLVRRQPLRPASGVRRLRRRGGGRHPRRTQR